MNDPTSDRLHPLLGWQAAQIPPDSSGLNRGSLDLPGECRCGLGENLVNQEIQVRTNRPERPCLA
jgi:hypothetical protein